VSPKVSFKSLLGFMKRPKKPSKEGYKAYLYIEGITAETGDLNRLIQCVDFDHGFHMSGGISPKPDFTGMTIRKPVDSHSPPLALAALTALTIPTMILYFYSTKATKVRDMIIMHNSHLTSVKLHTDPAGKGLMETLVFDVSKIQWNFASSSAGWDLLKNRPI
jgi:type VI protein secretion system component Hcp